MTAGEHSTRRSKHAVIAAHPEPASFTMSVARTYVGAIEALGQEALLRDLYRLDFDPVLKAEERLPEGPFTPAPDVADELAAIEGADVFVLVYPLWFGTPPAILKGYIERVLGAGFSRPGQYANRPVHPLFGGKQLLSFSSSGATERWMSEHGVAKALQSILDGYLARAFWMDTPQHVHFGRISTDLDVDTINLHLTKVRAEAELMCKRLQATQAFA
jgi:NAD(P)H dehydrogenase (quinone)